MDNVMQAPITEKKCRVCGVVKPVEEFYRESRNKDGYHSECKACKSAYDAKRSRDHAAEKRKINRVYYRQNAAEIKRKNVERQSRNPEKNRAHQAVYNAIRTGRLERPDRCQLCGQLGPVDAHHESYDRPLDVIFACRRCHMRLHGKYAREEITKEVY